MTTLKSKDFLPTKALDSELLAHVSMLIDRELEQYESDLDDVRLKYVSPEKLTSEVVIEILNELGFGYISDLAQEIQGVDYNNILVFSSYLAALKGHRTGYETVIKLLGLKADLFEWWETNPKRTADTIFLNVDLNASIILRPYITFQKFKRFTSEYIFPIFDPLQYTLVIPVPDMAWLVAGRSVLTVEGSVQDVTLDPLALYSANAHIVADTNGTMWNIKLNSAGQVKAFRYKGEKNEGAYALFSPDGTKYRIGVDTEGNIFTYVASDEDFGRVSISIYDRSEVNWLLKVNDDGTLFTEVAPSF